MHERVKNALEANINEAGLLLKKDSLDDGTFVTSVCRPDPSLVDKTTKPILFWRTGNIATIIVNLNFAEFNKPQRDAALLFICATLDDGNIPNRVIWNFDTRIPPDKLEGIVTYTPHKEVTPVHSS